MSNNVIKIAKVSLASAPRETFNKYNGTNSSNLKGKIVNYGDSNLYPQYLIDILSESPTTSAILKYKNNLINVAGYSGNELLSKVMPSLSDDYDTFGGFYLKIGWSRDKSVIALIEHIPFHWVRIGRPDNLNTITKFYVSMDWCDLKNYPAKEYDAFNPSNINEVTFTQIYYFGRYTKNMKIYPLPAYFPSQNYIALEGEISNYKLNNVKDGFTPTTIITMPTMNVSADEEQALHTGLKETATGKDGEKFLVLYGDGTTAPTVTTINGLDSNGSKELNEEVVQKICTSQGLNSPILAGLPTGSFFSNPEEIAIGSAYFYKQIIQPIQSEIVKAIEPILPYCKSKNFSFNVLSFEATKNEDNNNIK